MTFPAQLSVSQRFLDPYPLRPRNMYVPAVTGTSMAMQTNVTGGAANTKGSWVQLIASTPFAGSELLIEATNGTGASASERFILMDVALGPSGSPTILIENMQVGLTNPGNIYIPYRLPLHIPSGAEILVRYQCPVASVVTVWHANLIGDRGGVAAYRAVETYGANTTTSHGTPIPAVSNNTKGTWTEITSSTTEPIRALSYGISAEWQPQFSTLNYLFDIGVGGVGTEIAVAENLVVRTSTSEIIYGWTPTNFWVPLDLGIPVGSRLVARQQVNVGNIQDLELILYGWY